MKIRPKATTAFATLLMLALALGRPSAAKAQLPNDWDPEVPRMYACNGVYCEFFLTRYWFEDLQIWVYDRGPTIITYDCTGVWYWDDPYWEDNSWVESVCVPFP